jgi:hypothetical protein
MVRGELLIDNQEYTIVGGRIKPPTASLGKILKDMNIYKIIASTASCYELSNDLFPKREVVEQNKEEFKNSFFVSSVEKIAEYHKSLKDSYPEQTTSYFEKLTNDFSQFMKKLATGSNNDDIEIQYAVKSAEDLRKSTATLIEGLTSDYAPFKIKTDEGALFYLFDYPNKDDLDIYLKLQKKISLVTQCINTLYENDYEANKFHKSLLEVFENVAYVFDEFCNNGKTFVEKTLKKDALQDGTSIHDPSTIQEVLVKTVTPIQKMIQGAHRCYDLTHALGNIKEYAEAAVKTRYDKSVNLEIVKLISGNYRSQIAQDESIKLVQFSKNQDQNLLHNIASSADNKNSILLESINYTYAKHLLENETTNTVNGKKVPNVDFTEFYNTPYDGEYARFVDPSAPYLMEFLQDYKNAIDKNGVLVRLDDFSDVVHTFCHNQVETVEQIQKNVELNKVSTNLKDAPDLNFEFCKKYIDPLKDPESYGEALNINNFKDFCKSWDSRECNKYFPESSDEIKNYCIEINSDSKDEL